MSVEMQQSCTREQQQEQEIRILLEETRGPLVPYGFGAKLAREAIEKYFPKW